MTSYPDPSLYYAAQRAGMHSIVELFPTNLRLVRILYQMKNKGRKVYALDGVVYIDDAPIGRDILDSLTR